ncbi:helix-turn-helix domain-containing protein, partial [Vibrio cyclitrophicus]|uniref:helix-turn-helix domain-containing protein n=1 Tax=Vibrio cyclitrophicus TaxID=47951 RepID=UPI001F54166E
LTTVPQPMSIKKENQLSEALLTTIDKFETRNQKYLEKALADKNKASSVLTLISNNGNIRPMWKIERETIQHAINYCDGNVINAAVLLELSPSTVYRKKLIWESEDGNKNIKSSYT